jgi:2,4-dienoyl-CoA reductase-like NADH-dependent reductase (Old Yellow Enzyme family)
MKDQPIILMGGIRNPITADEILRKNYADFVSMGRPFIHEPDLPNRWKSGDLSPAKCISCNQCFTTQRPGPVYCVVKRKAEETS